MEYPRISVVTVVLNNRQYIEDCLLSVIEQGYPNLEYIVLDGGSTDGTLEILERYKDRIDVLVTGPDNGPAAALNKGFSLATGDIFCWLNSDDRLHAKALFAVAQIFNAFKTVDWIMGFPSWYTASGNCVNEIYYNPDRFYYSSTYINDNFNFKFARWSKWRFAMGDFNAIQQESVFWRKELWQKAGGGVREDLVAYDLELWTRFFEHADLFTGNILLGGFRIHGQQISLLQQARYKSEALALIETFKTHLLKRSAGHRLRLGLARLLKVFYYYELRPFKNMYIRLLKLPPYINFNLEKQEFELAEDN